MTMMKVIYSNPPNYEDIEAKFHPGKSVVYTYGDTLYNPYNAPLNHPLMVHEQTHAMQQGDDPKSWWNRYIDDPIYRVSQEVEAYRNQYVAFCKIKKDRNARARFLYILASDLSGEVYGRCVSFPEAHQKIKNS